jgi:mono/diheme cytochrome c family protein
MAPTEAPAEPKPPASRETARDIARPAAHQLPQPPFGISEDVFESGAHIYKARCAQCHGTPGRNAPASPQPAALQLWKKGIHGGIGVSAKDPGDTFEKTRDGIEHTGMPSYHRLLTDTQIWQVTLLLKNADQPLPDPVQQILR